jgi:hypothetical protein
MMKKVFKIIKISVSLFVLAMTTHSHAGTYREMVAKEDTISILKKAGLLKALSDNCNINGEKKDGLDTIIHDTILQASSYGKVKIDTLETTYKGSDSFYSASMPELCSVEDIDKVATELDLWNTSVLYQKVQALYTKPQELSQLSSNTIYHNRWFDNGMHDYDAWYDSKTGKAWIFHPMSRAQCMKEVSPYRKQSCLGGGLKEEVGFSQ